MFRKILVIVCLAGAIFLSAGNSQSQNRPLDDTSVGVMDSEAVAISPSQIVLSWTTRGAQPSGHVIERSEDGVTFQQIATLPGDANSFTDTSLPQDATRYYRVLSFTPAGESVYGEVAAATTLNAAAAAPVAPSSLVVKVSASPAQLGWFFRPPKNADNYSVANSFDTIILGKQDDEVREDLRAKGAPSPFLVYILSNQIHDPGSCTKQPFRNNAADRIGDFCNISTNHPTWFLKDKNGARIFKLDGSQKYYFMDPGNDEWRTFFITRAKENIDLHGWDGIFLDNIDGTLGRFTKIGMMPVKYPTDASYQAAVTSYLQDLYNTYFLPNNVPVYANLTEMGLSASAWLPYLQYLNGAFNESFATRWNGNYQEPSTLATQLTNSAETVKRGKKQILLCQGGFLDVARQQYCYGAFLLIAGPGANVRYSASGSYDRIFIYSNYSMQLGDPKGDRFFQDGKWKRNFTKGSVTVDPVAHTAQIVPTSGIQLDLSWKDNSTDESGFKIERSLDRVAFTQIATTGANTTRYSNTGLAVNKKYYYRVRAYNSSGNSAYTPVRSARTNPAVPSAPSNIATSFISSTQARITWTDNSSNETGFQVERSFNGTQFITIATRAASTTNYTDTLLTPSTRHYYRVSALNAGGASGTTASLQVTTGSAANPAAPTGLSATAVAGKIIKLQWTDTPNNDEGFRIERSTDGVNFTPIGSSPVNTPAYTDESDLVIAKKYYYRVRAFNSFGNSSYSNVANAITLP